MRMEESSLITPSKGTLSARSESYSTAERLLSPLYTTILCREPGVSPRREEDRGGDAVPWGGVGPPSPSLRAPEIRQLEEMVPMKIRQPDRFLLPVS